MRIWSLHPSLLDTKGLGGLWRETIGAQNVVGTDKGYSRHAQLIRWLETEHPKEMISRYLFLTWLEAKRRGYNYNYDKIDNYQKANSAPTIPVTEGQLQYEFDFLLEKLKARSPKDYKRVKQSGPIVHPMFHIIPGPVADWERVKV